MRIINISIQIIISRRWVHLRGLYTADDLFRTENKHTMMSSSETLSADPAGLGGPTYYQAVVARGVYNARFVRFGNCRVIDLRFNPVQSTQIITTRLLFASMTTIGQRHRRVSYRSIIRARRGAVDLAFGGHIQTRPCNFVALLTWLGAPNPSARLPVRYRKVHCPGWERRRWRSSRSLCGRRGCRTCRSDRPL